MLFPNLRAFAAHLRIIDATILVAAPILLRLAGVPAPIWEQTPAQPFAALLIALALAFIAISRRLDVYHVRRGDTLWAELAGLLEASVLASAVACLVVEVFFAGLPGTSYLTVTVSGIALLLGTRTTVRLTLRRLRTRGRDHRRWLLVGRNPRSAKIAREALAKPHYGIEIAAVLDAESEDLADGADPSADFREAPLSALPQYENLRPDFISDLLVREAIDEVVVALPLRRYYDRVSAVMSLCAEAGIPVKTPTRTFECISGQKDVVHLGAIPLVTYYSGPVKSMSLSIKRWLDIFAAACGLILTVPVAVVIALSIKLTSPGPLFFRQPRTGLHSRTFTMLKFRTMHAGAEDQQAELLSQTDGPAFKLFRDPRVTPVGRFLRRHHLDELPQLWNVLVGDMSLVGPRPLPPKEANGSTWLQRRRLTMQPGITCLWQVRSDHEMPFERWMELDLEYIDRWSLWLDVRVLFATVGSVVRGSGW